jgi:hypothetical protein
MKSIPVFLAGLTLGVAVFASLAPVPQGELRPGSLQPLLAGLGYEPKETAPGLWEVVATKDGLDIPIAVGLSESGRKLWMTVYLGELDEKAKTDAPRLLELLRKNYEIQPTHFFLTKGTAVESPDALKMGLAIDNRGISAASLKREVDKMVDDVLGSRPLWQKP